MTLVFYYATVKLKIYNHYRAAVVEVRACFRKAFIPKFVLFTDISWKNDLLEQFRLNILSMHVSTTILICTFN